ncbi:glycoside hydrolase family 3 protein [Fundicoccus sp. Sow4_F4]|uniref:glycoside hydrolase family 3 protein n=1 Tax=Fundicoccus sp. Sow4_F4 TaxID=3438783 RepID=UPI003F8FD98D
MKRIVSVPITKILTTIIVLLILVGGNSNRVKSNESLENASQSSQNQINLQVKDEGPITQSPEEILLAQMSLEEKVGQVFLARYPETESLKMADEYNLGGYIWFAHDFENKTPEQVLSKTTTLQENNPINMLMAVDEEGGTVTRISLFSQYREEPFESPYDYYLSGSWDEVRSTEQEKANLLKSLGFNMNLAPVADVTVTPEDFIFNRSFSSDPELVAKFIELSLEVFEEANVGAVLKHFPGYGSNVDTHIGIAYDNRTIDELRSHDFTPFKVGIENDVDAILVSHNVMTSIDFEVPATLSSAVINILRENLNYNGVIMTDDLIMDGLTQFASAPEAALLAIEAGNDLLISSELSTQWPAVLEAVKSGRISEERLNTSVLRILRLKLNLGIIE